MTAWPDILATALVGTARSGGNAEALLDTVAAQALRRRAGTGLVHGAQPPPPAPVDQTPTVGADAAARIDALLALDMATRDALPVRDMAGRLELLGEWLAAAAAAGRRLPAELVPALLDAGRRHRELRPYIAPAPGGTCGAEPVTVAGPLAGWLAAQHTGWAYASTTTTVTSTVDDTDVWELGPIGQRVAYLARLRERDPARGRELLEAAWDSEPPDDRVALLRTFATGLSTEDEALLERALDDRRKQIRDVALDLLAHLPDSGYARRMAQRARACVDLNGIRPPTECDRAMRRDGIAPRPPAGVGERAWWLEEILARTPLRTWSHTLLERLGNEGWAAAVRRGLARAAATQRDGAWATALVDRLTGDVIARGQPDDRLLLEALYDALPTDELATRATAALARGMTGAAAVGVEHVLALCPRPWPEPVVDAVFAALYEHFGQRGNSWRVTGICELAGLRLPVDSALRAARLAEQLRAYRPKDPGVAVIERLAATVQFRHDMLDELKDPEDAM